MIPELKPCPFCHDSAYPENSNPYSLRGYWVVMCSNCEAEGPAENNEFDAIAAWNRRSALADPAPAAQADDDTASIAYQAGYEAGIRRVARQQSATPAEPDYRKELAEAMGHPDGLTSKGKRVGLAWELLISYVKDWRTSIEEMEHTENFATPADAASEVDKIDYSLTRGDTVYSPYWGDGTRPVEVVDVNWALRAAAVRLSDKGGVVVWPVSHLQRKRQQGAQSNG